MSDPVATKEPGSNKSRALAFRDSVLVYLQQRGVTAARRPGLDHLPPARRMLHDNATIGVGPWLLCAHRQASMALAESLDHDGKLAATQAVTRYASVHHRRSHGIEDAYVTLPLHLFADLLHELQVTSQAGAA